jgi:hypothetical protein
MFEGKEFVVISWTFVVTIQTLMGFCFKDDLLCHYLEYNFFLKTPYIHEKWNDKSQHTISQSDY